MSFSEFIQEWVKSQGWEDQVEIDEDGIARLSFLLTLADQSFKVFIEGNDEKKWLELYMYPPFSVNAKKTEEMLRLFNHIHRKTYYGRLSLSDDGVIQYKQILCLADAEPTLLVLENMYRTGIDLFETWLDDQAAIAMTMQTYDDLVNQWGAGS